MFVIFNLKISDIKKTPGEKQLITSIIKESAIAGVLFVMSLIVIYLIDNHAYDFLSYHYKRGIQIESIYASIIYIGSFFGMKYEHAHRFGADQVISTLGPNLKSPVIKEISNP